MENLSIWETIALISVVLAIAVIIISILYGIYLKMKRRH